MLTGAAGDDRTLLNGGRLLETEREDAAQQLFLEAHLVEGLRDFVPVRLKAQRIKSE